jgi:hypothetical protein
MGTFIKRSLDPMNLIFKEKVETPTVAAATPMADANDPAVLAAKKRAAAKAAGGSGRSSTLLSGSSGGDYSAPTLG